MVTGMYPMHCDWCDEVISIGENGAGGNYCTKRVWCGACANSAMTELASQPACDRCTNNHGSSEEQFLTNVARSVEDENVLLKYMDAFELAWNILSEEQRRFLVLVAENLPESK